MCVLATIRTDIWHLGRTAVAYKRPLRLIWGLVSPPHSSLCALQEELTKSLSPALRSGQSTRAEGWSEGREKARVWVVLVKKTGRCLFKGLITFSVMGSPGSLKCHSFEAMGCHTHRHRGLWDWEICNRPASEPNLRTQHFHFTLLVKCPSNQALKEYQHLFHKPKHLSPFFFFHSYC